MTIESYSADADIWCGYCALKLYPDLDEQEDNEGNPVHYVLDDFADTPQHCGQCGTFLENGLTDDGWQYVAETIRRDLAEGRPDSVACTIWYRHYNGFSGDLDDMLARTA